MSPISDEDELASAQAAKHPQPVTMSEQHARLGGQVGVDDRAGGSGIDQDVRCGNAGAAKRQRRRHERER
jgi:hypothetical protein